jgi:hypothetical protein
MGSEASKTQNDDSASAENKPAEPVAALEYNKLFKILLLGDSGMLEAYLNLNRCL